MAFAIDTFNSSRRLSDPYVGNSHLRIVLIKAIGNHLRKIVRKLTVRHR